MMSKSDTEVYRLENKTYSKEYVFGKTIGKLIYLTAGIGLAVTLGPILELGGIRVDTSMTD